LEEGSYLLGYLENLSCSISSLFFRKPDTIEVQQMKAQNKEEKLAKQQEREKLQREIAARYRRD
jgi:outer membrane lipopolysaccharide assembly protein LptE/RlpB